MVHVNLKPLVLLVFVIPTITTILTYYFTIRLDQTNQILPFISTTLDQPPGITSLLLFPLLLPSFPPPLLPFSSSCIISGSCIGTGGLSITSTLIAILTIVRVCTSSPYYILTFLSSPHLLSPPSFLLFSHLISHLLSSCLDGLCTSMAWTYFIIKWSEDPAQTQSDWCCGWHLLCFVYGWCHLSSVEHWSCCPQFFCWYTSPLSSASLLMLHPSPPPSSPFYMFILFISAGLFLLGTLYICIQAVMEVMMHNIRTSTRKWLLVLRVSCAVLALLLYAPCIYSAILSFLSFVSSFSLFFFMDSIWCNTSTRLIKKPHEDGAGLRSRGGDHHLPLVLCILLFLSCWMAHPLFVGRHWMGGDLTTNDSKSRLVVKCFVVLFLENL